MEGNAPFILYNTMAGGDDTGGQGVSNHAIVLFSRNNPGSAQKG